MVPFRARITDWKSASLIALTGLSYFSFLKVGFEPTTDQHEILSIRIEVMQHFLLPCFTETLDKDVLKPVVVKPLTKL